VGEAEVNGWSTPSPQNANDMPKVSTRHILTMACPTASERIVPGGAGCGTLFSPPVYGSKHLHTAVPFGGAIQGPRGAPGKGWGYGQRCAPG
jgi:hypothetical protein